MCRREAAARDRFPSQALCRGLEVPGGYVEPGESPRTACIREVREELGIQPPIGSLLVVDWAPMDGEGDKILFLFDGGTIAEEWRRAIALQAEELTGWRFATTDELPALLPPRLSRRVLAAIVARACCASTDGRTARGPNSASAA